MNKTIYTYNISELPELLNNFNQPSFRAKQLATWLYRDFAQSYDEMTNLPASLRKELSSQCPLNPLVILDKQISRDGTRKYVFVFDNNTQVEAVGIPSFSKKNSKDEPKHLTVCFSTQAGCAMQCAFCATGEEGLTEFIFWRNGCADSCCSE
jgi:23S rRNA (adenine2503-C2)-methyltransferase